MTYPSLLYHAEPLLYHFLKVPRASPIPPCLPTLNPTTTYLFNVAILLPFPEWHIVVSIEYVGFSNQLLSLSNNMHLRFLHIFKKIAYFLKALNNIPFYGCTSLFTHSPTEDNLAASTLHNYEQRCYKHLCTGFFMDISFQLI